MNLLKETTLTFKRQAGQDELQADGTYTRTPSTEFEAIGSLQPYKKGKVSTKLPEGVTTDSAFIFYTKTKLNTYNTVEKTLADTAEINGRAFEVVEFADWSYTSLTPSHFMAVLVMQDKNSGRWDR
jgi:hypothetical protein